MKGSTTALMLILTALAMVGFFLRALPSHRFRAALLLGSWMLLQYAIAASDFYLLGASLPPRFALALVPPLGIVMLVVLLPNAVQWIAQLDVRSLLWVHVLRVPIEVVLHRLYQEGGVPVELTWSGRNWDVLSGLSAAMILWRCRGADLLHRPWFRYWNIAALLLVLNVLVCGVLSGPSPFQQFRSAGSDLALLQAPFVWLPSVLVPLVILAHGATLVRIARTRSTALHE